MTGWEKALREEGFVFAPGVAVGALLAAAAASADGAPSPGASHEGREAVFGWREFAASWDDLGVDTYMADGGRYRKRRHAAFAAGVVDGVARAARKPDQPHYQSRDYNALNGGIARWFDPVLPAVAEGAAFQAIMALCTALFDSLTPAPSWHVEAHQFRIEARPGAAGQPTPEGMHQDGVDWVLVLMVGRRNIAEGTTTIHGLHRGQLGSFTLADPMDAALLDDHRVFHGVTAVQPLDLALPAYRDVLVLTYRRESGGLVGGSMG